MLMSNNLVCIKPIFPIDDYKYVLVVRRHDLSGCDYETITRLTQEQAFQLVDNSNVYFLFGDPRLEKTARIEK